MSELRSISSSTPTAPSQDASEPKQNSATAYGVVRPSFSYLNGNNPPSGSSQLSSASSAVEQGHSPVGRNASSPTPSAHPAFLHSPVPLHSSQPGAFVPGTAAQVMTPPGPQPVGLPQGSSSHFANFSFNGHQQLMQNNLSLETNVRANTTQEIGAIASAQVFTQSASQPALTNPSPSVTVYASNSFSSTAAWLPPAPFQVTPGMPRTPITPGPPGIASSVSSSSNISAVPSSVDSPALPRSFMPAAPVLSNFPIQQQTFTPYPTPFQAAPPGPWLQSPIPQISGIVRPSFSPYPTVIPGPFPMSTRPMLPVSVSFPNTQPPGVTPAVSSVGDSASSVASGDQSTIGSVQEELPPGIDSSKHVNNDEIKDEASVREQLDAWTAHRTESGVVYYYNSLTGVSTYEKPLGFKDEPDKAAMQPTPISWEKLAGTDWAVVTTNDGRRYYYNTRTQLSSWQIPNEVMELKKKQDADCLEAQSLSAINSNVITEKGSAPVSLSTPAANTGGRDTTALRPSGVSGQSSALDLIKRKLQDSGTPAATSTGSALSGGMVLELNGSKTIEDVTKVSPHDDCIEKHKDANGDGDLSDSSSDSEDEDRGPTKEECINQFKEMLKERGVAPFSKWDKELPKIVFDPRFKAIPSHSARRALFEHYVRTRAEEERKEKRAAQRAAVEGFKQLLEEAKEDIDCNTDYQTFKSKWGKDPRFEVLSRKEREFLLNERVLPLKRTAEEKAQAEHAAAISNFKSMLQDKGDITSSSRWSKVKDSLKTDARYKSIKHDDREKLFNEYISELKAAEKEIEGKAKTKQDEEGKLKERERALRKRKEREELEVERVRIKARRMEAAESYKALLVETIKDPQASWTGSKPKLEKDPQGRAANPHLDQSDLEKLFREHVKALHERCVVDYKALLAEVITADAAARETEDGKTVVDSWSTAKLLLKSDPRYNKMPRKDRESLWWRHAEEIQRKQKFVRDQETEKHAEGRSRNTVDSDKYVSGSRKATHDRK
ncbi:pre-mRNA-processing 40C isoform X1 [Olea europaea subsp. europaea]|uniref:Pre-mRNA-processing 40C isoform X1 n=1 Tax=Olea europaea subsp. europaea TaxID=158383 RepID=A0A8S0RK04_OLEEU|nr:pre-mRNA-processing 40C isoform X1 [Olea europaea subsp. europaea]